MPLSVEERNRIIDNNLLSNLTCFIMCVLCVRPTNQRYELFFCFNTTIFLTTKKKTRFLQMYLLFKIVNDEFTVSMEVVGGGVCSL